MSQGSATLPRSSERAVARSGNGLQLTTEISLAVVTSAAIIGMHRLFGDGSYFPPLLAQLLVAHLTVAVLRRAGVRLAVAGLAVAVVAILSITWAQYLDTTTVMIPTGETMSAMDAEMDAAWELFRDVRAPAPVHPGFVVATSLAIWAIVFIADWGAFRTGVSFEALLPPATLFLFAAVLGDDRRRAPSAVLFVAACLFFLLVHRTWRQEDTATWAAVHSQRSRWSLLSAGGAMASVAVVVGGFLGPNLPGADDVPIINWRNTGDDQTRRVVSPLVDIRSRLVDQSTIEVFTAQVEPVDAAPYWRLTALDEFTGEIWRSSYETDDADGELPDSVEADANTTRVTQTITVTALAQIWLPAAFEPVAIDPGDSEVDVDFDSESGTLLVDEAPTSDEMTYTVVSEVPTWSEAQLRGASERLPEDIARRYRQLPGDFSEDIRAEAERVTADAPTNYDKAMALQSYLRDNFGYTTDVQPDHSEDAMEDFLFVNRQGYCEQFAGTYAAMARSIGLASRVVVGFTKGEEEPSEPGFYRVKGVQAHAWVEVYFPDYGWVLFDPTPGRGPAGGEDWLGIPEDQETLNQEAGDVPEVPRDTGSGTTGDPSQRPTREEDVASGAPTTPTTAPPDDEFLPEAVTEVAKTAGVGVLVYVVVVPLAFVGLRLLRRLRARAPVDRVMLGWHDVSAATADAGLSLAYSLTVSERATRMRQALPEVAADIDLVAGWVEKVNYAGTEPSPEDADAAMQAASATVGAANRRQLWYVRALRYLDARRLIPESDRVRRSAHSAIRTS